MAGYFIIILQEQTEYSLNLFYFGGFKIFFRKVKSGPELFGKKKIERLGKKIDTS